MPANASREAGPSTLTTATPSRRAAPPTTLQRLRSGGDAASTLQSSAVAAIGSIRTLASVSSSGTSLHPIAPRRAIKVVLIGDGGCGKTSMRNRFLTNSFFPSYRATIGADFITKTLPIDPNEPDGEKATLQIWDTAGQERFQSLGSAFYRGADAVIIAFDATKSDESLERVKVWYDAFMQKAPGPADEADRRRFCWICAANKSDLIEDGGSSGKEREKVRAMLDGLVAREEGEVDWGIDPGQTGERPSGAEEPANPAEVLSRPDPNGIETAPQHQSTPSRRSTGSRAGAGADAASTPPARLKHSNGDASPTASRTRTSKSNYRLSRKSLSSIAAAAAQSAQQAESSSDVDEPAPLPNGDNGGTVNTMYATPYNTMSNLPLSTSPTATELTPKGGEEAKSTGSGFLSSWMTRSKSKAASSSKANGARGHNKRQSIKSIEVFQISDQEAESDAASDTAVSGPSRFAFPSSSSNNRIKAGAHETPPRSVKTAGGVSMKDRQRVDSTMSLNAPSVYHTPRSSTFFSVSPTPRTTLGIPRDGRDDGSIRHGHARNTSASSSLRLDPSRETESHTSNSKNSNNNTSNSSGVGLLKHKPSIASSSLSVATVRPTGTGNQMLRAPKSINDLFQPAPPESLSPPPPKTAASTISLPTEPPAPAQDLAGSGVETGFTLFYTSAKTGHNIERMFAHIVQRVATAQAYAESLDAAAQEADTARAERERRESELIRRTIRLADGKNPDKRWFGCC